MAASYTPKLLTTLREGYSVASFRADAIAGLTVAIVALPLAMALGIASGATPDKGLVTAVIAGFLISALGGSRVQIGGPTGAFVVVIFNVIAQHGHAFIETYGYPVHSGSHQRHGDNADDNPERRKR